jgi:DNA-binding MarR family transcriptional regulator
MYMHIIGMSAIADPPVTRPSSLERQEFLDRQPTYWLKRSYQALRRRVDEQLRPAGISLSQRDALLTLYHYGSATHGALAERLGLEQSSVSRLIDGLARRSLVVARAGTTDRRSRLVSLTDDGKALLERTPGAAKLAGSILATKLSATERTELVRLLRKCTEALETAE